jgi:hypothetical protein
MLECPSLSAGVPSPREQRRYCGVLRLFEAECMDVGNKGRKVLDPKAFPKCKHRQELIQKVQGIWELVYTSSPNTQIKELHIKPSSILICCGGGEINRNI